MTGPIGRPAALSQPAESPRKQAPSAQLSPRTDGAKPRPLRVGPGRLRQITDELTDTDRAVLEFLAQTRLATGTQLARRLWASTDPSDRHARAARRALHRLERERLVGRLGRRMGGVRAGSSSIVYCLEAAGHRLLGNGRKKRTLTDSHDAIFHTLMVTELTVQLHEHTSRSDLRLSTLQTEPTCWRSYPGVLGSAMTLRPDLFVALASPVHEDRWFIEVDRATESPSRIRSKAIRYLDHFQTGDEQHRHGAYPRVVWTASGTARVEKLRTILHRLDRPAAQLFVVWQFDEVAGRLIAEGSA